MLTKKQLDAARALPHVEYDNKEAKLLAGCLNLIMDHIDEQQKMIEELQRKLDSAEAFERSVNEALNSGDGVYRP